LGWRIIFSCGDQGVARARVCKAAEDACGLEQVIPDNEREKILKEAQIWAATHHDDGDQDEAEPLQSVAITSYEGSKGRSAQYVFLIGVHSGELPADAAAIKDIEICKFVVGLTRTKKQCTILLARNAMGEFKRPSEFLTWIAASRLQKITVNKSCWET
jgi:superfamily I DNA/RNA helicase